MQSNFPAPRHYHHYRSYRQRKTTSLYAILNQLKAISTKVITIEDPVEIKMPLINQVQINEKQGITFAHATRAFLRHDPNIILIGEIRDLDTGAGGDTRIHYRPQGPFHITHQHGSRLGIPAA